MTITFETKDNISLLSLDKKLGFSNIGYYIASDFSCSKRYHDSCLFSLPNTIQIILYIDAFTLVNLLGTSAKQHKICAIYFTIGNIPYYQRS